MALTFRTIILILVVLIALLTVPVLIGVYVYRDSRRRGMNAVLWTLIAVVAPALTGFIIYLLIRGNYSDLRCPQCDGPVTEQYTVCPHCGAKLHPACPNCSFPVEPDWSVCPKCSTPLDGADMYYTPPLRQRDRSLSKILIAIIIVPVALMILAVFGLTAFQTTTGTSTSSEREVTFDEYEQAEPGAAELPERLSVVKIVGNAVAGGNSSSDSAASSNAGVVEVTDEDMMFRILAAIDSGERLPMEKIPDYDFKDGFEIVVEYQIHDDLITHPDMARHLVFMDDGICYLIDDRVTNTAHGSSYRIMGDDFYVLLEELFQ